MDGLFKNWLLAVATLCVGTLLHTPATYAHPADQLVGGANAHDGEVILSGVLDGRRDRVRFEGLTVKINGVEAGPDSDGNFAAAVPLSRYYRVDITGPQVFSMVQTFGNAELRDDACQCLRIPAIELVKRKPGRIELFFGGDSMAGRRYFKARSGEKAVLDKVTLEHDLDRLFASIKPYIATSDFASINLESVVAAEQPGPPAPKKYLFFTPPQIAPALKRAGVDHVTLGNNHTADYRDAGMRSTIEALDAGGIAWSGAGMDVTQAETAARFNVEGERLGVFGFVGWRGWWTPNQIATAEKSGAAWGLRSVVERVTVRERRAGYTPIMHFHGNKEYADRPSDLSLPRFRTAIEKGAPVVIGHHPHVTHGLEIYRGGLIAHSLGNFLFDQEHPHTQVTYALKVWLEDGDFLRAEAIPLQMLDYRPVPAVGGMRQASLTRLYWLSAEMGTVLAQSGGHAVVWKKKRGFKAPVCSQPNGFRLTGFAPACLNPNMDLGRNMVPRGDFENTRMLEAKDRFWASRQAGVEFRWESDGNGVMAVLPEGTRKPSYLYSKSYIRDVYATRFSLRSRIFLPRDADIELIVKERPRESDPRTSSVKGISQGFVSVSGGDWQDLTFDFSRPEEAAGAARAFRFILKVMFKDKSENGERTILLDDFELIEWPDDEAQGDPTQAWRWTHVRPKSGAKLASQKFHNGFRSRR